MHIKDVRFESKISNISKYVENTVFIDYSTEIQNRYYRSNMVSKFETVVTIYQK